jgi:hypothetical protein
MSLRLSTNLLSALSHNSCCASDQRLTHRVLMAQTSRESAMYACLSQPSTGGRSDIEAQLIAPDKPVFRHDCNRFEVTFTYANSSKPVTDLQTAPHPSMHALSVAHRNSSNAAAAGAIVMQEWLAWPAAAEAAVLDADKRGLDLCNMDAYYNQDQASSAGGSLVLYMRFEHAGQHQLFLQVLLCTPVSKRAIDDVCTACICTVC